MSNEQTRLPGEYPEHEKLSAVKEQSQAIGGFLDWLINEQGCHIAEYPGDSDELMPISNSIERLLATYFDIDLGKIAAEKDAMLEDHRALNRRK